jgi:hypothetical protein
MNNQVKKEVKKNKRKIAAWWWSIGAVLTLATLVTCSVALPEVNVTSNSTPTEVASSSVNNQINNISLIGIEVSKTPSITTYTPVDIISTRGGELRLVYSDYSVKYIPMNDGMIDSSKLKLSTLGTSKVNLVYLNEGNSFSTSYDINVVAYEVKLEKLSLDINQTTIVQGQSLQLNLNLEPINADLVYTTWVSSNDNIISVDRDGLVLAKGIGQAVVTVNANGIIANANFTVVEDLQLIKESQFRIVNQENTYIAEGYIPIQTISELNMIREDTRSFTASYNNVTYTFEDYAELETNNLNALKRNYILMSDLNFNNLSNWTPIGSEEFKFLGKFYGNNKTISNLKIARLNDDSESDNIGLFGYVESDQLEIPSITRLTLENPFIVGRDRVGALVGYLNNAKIDYIQIKSSEVLDIESYLTFIQEDSELSTPFGGTIQGRSRVGGVVGRNVDGIIDNVINEVTVRSIYDSVNFTANRSGFIGGIVGGSTLSDPSDVSKIAEITNVVNHGFIFTIERNFVGGIVGGSGLLLDPFNGNMRVQNAINNGDIITIDLNLTQSDNEPFTYSNETVETVIGVGGIAGANGGVISYVENYGQIGVTRDQYLIIISENNVTGIFDAESQYEEFNGDSVGGIVGNNFFGAVVVSASNYNSVYGADRVGGIVGSNSGYIMLSSNTNPLLNGNQIIKTISGFNLVGGITGFNVDFGFGGSNNSLRNNIQSVFNQFDVYGVYDVGGIAGRSFFANILRAGNIGNVNGGYYAGGLVGSAQFTAIRESFNFGNIVKLDTDGADAYYDPSPQEIISSYFGGLVGESDEVIVERSFNIGEVAGVEHSGGLIGYADDYTVLVENYHAGSIDADSIVLSEFASIGSLIGSFDSSDYIFIANISFEERPGLDSIGEIVSSNSDTLEDFENDYAIKIIDGNLVDNDFNFILDNTPDLSSGGLDYFYRWNIDETYYQVWQFNPGDPFPLHKWYLTFDDESLIGLDESYPNYVYYIAFDEIDNSFIDSDGYVVETIDVDGSGNINFIDYAITLVDSDDYTIPGSEETVRLRNNKYTNIILEVENLVLTDLASNGIKLYAMTNAQYQTYLTEGNLTGVVSFDEDTGLDLIDFGINTALDNSEAIIFEINDLTAPRDVYLIKLVYEDDRLTTLDLGDPNVRVHIVTQNFNPFYVNIN